MQVIEPSEPVERDGEDLPLALGAAGARAERGQHAPELDPERMLPERERHGVAEQRAPEAQPALHQPLAGPAYPELHQVRRVHQRALERGGLLVARAEVLEPDGELLVAPQPIQRMRNQLARVGEEDQARRGRGTPGERPDPLRLHAGLGSDLRRLQRLEREPDQPLAAEWIERPTEGSPPLRGQRPWIRSSHRVLQRPRSLAHVAQRPGAPRRQLGTELVEEIPPIVLRLPCAPEELGGRAAAERGELDAQPVAGGLEALPALLEQPDLLLQRDRGLGQLRAERLVRQRLQPRAISRPVEGVDPRHQRRVPDLLLLRPGEVGVEATREPPVQ